MKRILTLFTLAFFAQGLFAQAIATWDFEGNSVLGQAGISQATPASATVVRASNSGIQAVPGGNLGLTGLGWPTGTNPGYFQAEVLCPNGDCDLLGVSFAIHSATGAPESIRVDYSLGTNFSNPQTLGTFALTANSTQSFNLPVFSPNVSRVAVRIFGLPTSFQPFAIMYLEGLSINGTVSTAPLPLEWTSIAIDDLGDVANLRWTTASETDLSHFIVEVAYGNEEFSPLGKVEPNDAVQGRSEYNYLLSKQNARLYARIRAVDLDGSESLSEVVALKVDTRDPSVRLLLLSQNSAQLVADEDTSMEIFDNQGRFWRKLNLQAQETSSIDLSDLPSGIYYLVSPMQTLSISVLK